jgi:hypothetical protein
LTYPDLGTGRFEGRYGIRIAAVGTNGQFKQLFGMNGLLRKGNPDA